MLGIVCALKCEAESLIDHLHLTPYSQRSPFSIYSKDHIFLIISGIGKLNAAAALMYLYTITGERAYTSWLNVGVGGHPVKEVGEGVLAHQVIDVSSQRCFYPTMSWKHALKTDAVCTVDGVESDYPTQSVYDMEASGFCSSALRVSQSELVHCYKVVSDNRLTHPTRDPQRVHSLIALHLDSICEIIDQITHLQQELIQWTSVSEILLPFISNWHFTNTQIYQLQRYLQRWEALFTRPFQFDPSLLKYKKAKDVLTFFEQRMALGSCSL